MILRFKSLALLALAVAAGCSTPDRSPSSVPSRSSAEIREVHLFGVPVALNLDQVPGPDGFAVRVYVSGAGQARGQAVREGRLEILMYDGVLSGTNASASRPVRVWSYTPDKLREHAGNSSLGIGYRFALRWEADTPRQGRVTIIARHVSRRGQTVASAPSIISLAVK